MPELKTSQEWLQQSSLLLKARPTTTRITTKYNIPHPDKAAKAQKRKRPHDEDDASKPETDASKADALPKATLTLKTFDPTSGTVLKYKTDKAAEVGRLIASLGSLGRGMAGLPEIAEDAAIADMKAEEGTGTHTPVPEAVPKTAATESKGAQGGGGGKKKKKGKK